MCDKCKGHHGRNEHNRRRSEAALMSGERMPGCRKNRVPGNDVARGFQLDQPEKNSMINHCWLVSGSRGWDLEEWGRAGIYWTQGE